MPQISIQFHKVNNFTSKSKELRSSNIGPKLFSSKLDENEDGVPKFIVELRSISDTRTEPGPPRTLEEPPWMLEGPPWGWSSTNAAAAPDFMDWTVEDATEDGLSMG
jgi:hypothetical protein